MNERIAEVPEGVDPDVPSSARAYSYLLNPHEGYYFEVDKAVAQHAQSIVYEMTDVAQTNRVFVRRVTRWLVAHGIHQIIDIGSGLPTDLNTHEIAQAVEPEVRVVYVDKDLTTKIHGEALVADNDRTIMVQADVREPKTIVDHPEIRAHLDFDQPIAYIMASLFHMVPDEFDPHMIIRTLMDAVPSGSYMALSQITSDDHSEEKVNGWYRFGDEVGEPAALRTVEQIHSFFDGLELIPGYEGAPEDELVWSNQWGAKEPEKAHNYGSWIRAGLGRKP